MASWTYLSHNFSSFNEIHSIIIMLWHTSCNCKDIQIKNDIFWWKPYLFSQNFKSSLRNLNFSINFSCLSLFIKSHNNNSSSILLYFSCFFNEILFTFFQRDTIYNTFALAILKTSFNYFKLG
jgi:hypothetical protein